MKRHFGHIKIQKFFKFEKNNTPKSQLVSFSFLCFLLILAFIIPYLIEKRQSFNWHNHSGVTHSKVCHIVIQSYRLIVARSALRLGEENLSNTTSKTFLSVDFHSNTKYNNIENYPF